MALISLRRMVVLILMAVFLIGGTVFGAATIARQSDVRAARMQSDSQLMLTAMINQETGARGYFQTRDPVFLQPYNHGASAFAQALSDSRSLAGADPELRLALTDQGQQSLDWHTAAQAEINRLQNTGTPPTVTQALADKATMDGFRAVNTSYNAQLAERHNAAMSAQTWYAVGLAAALSIGLVLAGLFLVRRSARREGNRLARQRELRELLQVSESEHESRMLLIRHIERTVPGSAAAVFNRNNSDDRLEPLTGERARGHTAARSRPRGTQAAVVPGGAPQPPSRAGTRRNGADAMRSVRAGGGACRL